MANIHKLLNSSCRFNLVMYRNMVTTSVKNTAKQQTCREWRIEKYGSLDNLTFVENGRRPAISGPNQLLVRILASSVNPIDVGMAKGYGAKFLNVARMKDCAAQEFPLVLGRDFVGEVVFKGMGVKEQEFDVGQKVWGVIPVHNQGAHRDFVTVDKSYVSTKPSNLSDVDSSGILYAGLTAWSGLFVTGAIGGPLGATTSAGGGRGKRVLVLGGAGGVGALAIQMLVAERAAVSATCSKDAVAYVEKLGVPDVIDYAAGDADEKIAASGPFDVVLDCAGKTSAYASVIPCKFKQYITFNSPLLRNVEEFGLLAGSFKNLTDLIENNFSTMKSENGLVKWGYFLPAPHGIQYLQRLVERGQIVPSTQAVFPFAEADKAYKRVEEGHLRGKIIINYV